MASPILRIPWCFLLLALTGCEPALTEGAGAGGSDPVLGTSEAEIRISNSLTTQELVTNAIAANHTANELLATNSLESLFDPAVMSPSEETAFIANQLRDPYAQRFMEYLVGCALGPEQTLHWLNPSKSVDTQLSVWKGSAGLCPRWLDQPPAGGPGCLNRVTACLLARNNGLGYRVELSMRGEIYDPELGIEEPFTLDTWTTPLDHVPTSRTSLPSAEPCDTATVGAGRDCGWTMHSVGWCPAGQTISVGAGGPASCPAGTPMGSSVGARMVMRVCRGIAGCDSTDGRLIASSQGCSANSSWPFPSAATDPSVRFSCPAQGGYFSVMTAPWNSTMVGQANVAVTSGVPAPLPERSVYRIREGAFYGNLFGRGALRKDVNVTVTQVTKAGRYVINRPKSPQAEPLFNNLYSCYDPGWVHGMAYATYRVCALPGTHEDCAATVTGPCWTVDPMESHQCESQDGPLMEGDGDFEECRDPANDAWMEPVTVYLNGACDLVDDQHLDLCKRWMGVEAPSLAGATMQAGTQRH
ncbi:MULTISPECIES: hypothetical protein [Corallococcus]|uniref:hypothetical protein n=1 Tax=Corallococcus TaxID=83461 RepID=UPI0011808930|nr:MULTISPECIES: hypothetical protein [Corallococcus]NBD08836.1 hypothetical protein [Corallococcus silvisoli]TSC32785.1 hypothetical protein FOF48_07225 [Corallococcus sp. Z5C101001]